MTEGENGRTQFAPTVWFCALLAFPSGRLSHKMGEMSAKQTERDGPRKGKVSPQVTDEENAVTIDYK